MRPPSWLWALRYGPERLLGRARGALGPRGDRVSVGEGVDVVLPPPARGDLNASVLFYAIDGAGLGHLARCLAVARRIEDASCIFITTSQRADVLESEGLSYEKVPVFELPDAGASAARRAWQDGLSASMRRLLAAHRPAVVVADGVAADVGLVRALAGEPAIARVGIRRAYRRDGRQHLVAARDRGYNLLLIPHERDGEPVVVPSGPAAAWVGPLMVTGKEEALSRERARRVLGLPASGPCALIQLGAGRIGRGKALEASIIEWLAPAGITVAVTTYDPTQRSARDHVVPVTRFPLAPAMPAFDFAISAAGYNTFHELMHHGVPTIFVPNEATLSDDQVGRARRAERAGAALLVRETQPDALRTAVERLAADDDLRGRLARDAAALVPRNGAGLAAGIIERLVAAVRERTGGSRRVPDAEHRYPDGTSSPGEHR